MSLLITEDLCRNLGIMEVKFTPEQEEQLAQLASRTGTDPEQQVKQAALRLIRSDSEAHSFAPELPVLHLGAMKSLHRRDIYDDVG